MVIGGEGMVKESERLLPRKVGPHVPSVSE